MVHPELLSVFSAISVSILGIGSSYVCWESGINWERTEKTPNFEYWIFEELLFRPFSFFLFIHFPTLPFPFLLTFSFSAIQNYYYYYRELLSSSSALFCSVQKTMMSIVYLFCHPVFSSFHSHFPLLLYFLYFLYFLFLS